MRKENAFAVIHPEYGCLYFTISNQRKETLNVFLVGQSIETSHWDYWKNLDYKIEQITITYAQ